jgi:hypothetical protein
MVHRRRYISILLLALFAVSSLVSPDLFVLCSGDDEGARIEAFHMAKSACSAGPDHRCRRPAVSPAEIHHRHVRCTDVGLSGHLGLVKERERLQPVVCLRVAMTPGPTADLNDGGSVIASGAEFPAFQVSGLPPGVDLLSVVLIV